MSSGNNNFRRRCLTVKQYENTDNGHNVTDAIDCYKLCLKRAEQEWRQGHQNSDFYDWGNAQIRIEELEMYQIQGKIVQLTKTMVEPDIRAPLTRSYGNMYNSLELAERRLLDPGYFLTGNFEGEV